MLGEEESATRGYCIGHAERKMPVTVSARRGGYSEDRISLHLHIIMKATHMIPDFGFGIVAYSHTKMARVHIDIQNIKFWGTF